MTDRLLLDTHMILWIIRGNERAAWLQPCVEDVETPVLVSAISFTEIAIKASIGKLPDDVSKVREAMRRLRVREIAFDADHAESLAQLPLHHRDPFDRMLVAQALAEDLVIATSDPKLARYEGVRVRSGEDA